MTLHRPQDRSERTGDSRYEPPHWQAEASRHAYSSEHGLNGGQHGRPPHTHSQHLPDFGLSGHEGGRPHAKHHDKHHQYGQEQAHHDKQHPHGKHHHSADGAPSNAERPSKHEKHEKAGISGDAAAMAQLVARHAADMGLTKNATIAAVATMLQESGGDPNKPGDVGKYDHQAHSFGLFQLNFRGGEGTANHLTTQQALDPDINARTALKYFKQHQHRTSNPGELAQMAQRPGDPNYISHVNQYVGMAKRLLGFV